MLHATAAGCSPLSLRNIIVPVAGFGPNLAWPLIGGLIFRYGPLVDVGIALFTLAMVLHFVILPVEFSSSSRAIKTLTGEGCLAQDEIKSARKVLNATALTYLASSGCRCHPPYPPAHIQRRLRRLNIVDSRKVKLLLGFTPCND